MYPSLNLISDRLLLRLQLVGPNIELWSELVGLSEGRGWYLVFLYPWEAFPLRDEGSTTPGKAVSGSVLIFFISQYYGIFTSSAATRLHLNAFRRVSSSPIPRLPYWEAP